MTLAVLGLLVPTAILYWGIAPPRSAGGQRWAHAFALAQAMVLSIGITSCLWFVWMQTFGGTGRSYAVVEPLLLCAGAAALRRVHAADVSGTPAAKIGAAAGHAAAGGMSVTRWASIVLGLLIAAWIASFLCNTALHPHGSWDAVSIWNLDARFLARGGESWREFIRNADSCAFHGDYPLLLPSAVARLWSIAGATDPRLGALVGFWFAAATVLLCSACVGCLRGTTQAFLAAVALLGTGDFVEQSSTQYADIPLAAYMLAAVSALALCDEIEGAAPRWLVLAGVAAGLAAWSKNEGMMFAVAVIAVRELAAGVRGNFGTRVPLAAGMALPLLLVGYFKVVLAPGNDLLAGQAVSATTARLLSPGRYLATVAGLGEGLLAMAKGLAFALPIYFAVVGRTRAARGPAGSRTAVIFYALMLAGYCGVYLVTPLPLAWHLETSSRRVLLQLWPGFLLAFFLAVAAPEERFGGGTRALPATPATRAASP